MSNFEWHDAHKGKPYVADDAYTSKYIVMALGPYEYELGTYYRDWDGCYFQNTYGQVVHEIEAWMYLPEYEFPEDQGDGFTF